jgi:uncharacterized integral membrane protein (TIGR00698 family)
MATTETQRWWASEDWLAVWMGGALLAFALAAVLFANSFADEAGPTPTALVSPLHSYIAAPAKWVANPVDSLLPGGKFHLLPGLIGVLLISTATFGVATRIVEGGVARFTVGFLALFVLATLALVIAAQQGIHHLNLEYALWALLIGLVISNTVGTPAWLRPAVRTELYIKTGLVLLGAGILFGRLLELGLPGLCVAWVVTPIVLVTTFWFGQQVLKIPSKSLNIVISADMSVCGVSAAIATAAACRAKKEELSLAIGISLAFTVIMMVVQPWVIRASGMNEVVGGAWIGGTIDSSGAVVAAGEMVSEVAGFVAVTVKMIQNILIGVVAFGVAVYWVRFVERGGDDARPDAREIWRRFPKFVIGFLAASAVFSLLAAIHPQGKQVVQAVLQGGPGMKQGIDTLRGWFFALAFVSIGLESNFHELGRYLRGGKPVVLYICGQAFSLCLSLAMAWLMFEVVFSDVTERLLSEAAGK